MRKIPAIAVNLTDEQIESIQPFMEKVEAAAAAGKPIMLLAQVFSSRIKVFIATQEQAHDIQRAMQSPVGLTNGDLT